MFYQKIKCTESQKIVYSFGNELKHLKNFKIPQIIVGFFYILKLKKLYNLIIYRMIGLAQNIT